MLTWSLLCKYLKSEDITPIHGRPLHLQTQGKIERYHRSLKNVVKLDNYYCLEELEDALKQFVHYYNHQRYQESLNKLTPSGCVLWEWRCNTEGTRTQQTDDFKQKENQVSITEINPDHLKTKNF